MARHVRDDLPPSALARSQQDRRPGLAATLHTSGLLGEGGPARIGTVRIPTLDDVTIQRMDHVGVVVGGLEQYEDSYRLCYVRGPEDIIVALAEQLS